MVSVRDVHVAFWKPVEGSSCACKWSRWDGKAFTEEMRILPDRQGAKEHLRQKDQHVQAP